MTLTKRVMVSVIGLLAWAASTATAQSVSQESGLEAPASATSPADPFATGYEAAVSAYRAAIDFSAPFEPVVDLPATGAVAGDGLTPWSLDELLALAAGRNPGLRALAEAEAAAAADLAGARARRLPTLRAETSGTYIGNPMGPIALTAGQLGAFQGVSIPPEDVIIYKGMESYNYDFALIGEVPLYTWGKIAIGVDLARAGLDAAGLQRRKAERELAARMRGDWDALACLRAADEMLGLQATIGRRLVELAEASAEAGFMTRADLAGARIKLKEIDIARVRLDERRDKLLAELASMAGLDALSKDDLEMTPPIAGSPRWTEAEAGALALGNSYDLALLEAQLVARRGLRDLAEAEAKGRPDIGLRVELSYGGSRLPFVEKDWFGQDDYQLTFSVGTSGNIFGNAVKEGEAAKARALLAEAAAQRADAERAIRSFVRDTWLGMELGRARLEYAALRQEGWAADLAQKRAALRAGGGSESEYLTGMIEALGSLAEAYGTLAEYRGALVSLDALAGSPSPAAPATAPMEAPTAP
ncbi:MAG TPA: TolC family protein [Spirochaetales bacterium]|nr:TolC family protein [Spirochaetales bacterium]HPG85076.1 TolC family protein [Spirochaetales bacterium]